MPTPPPPDPGADIVTIPLTDGLIDEGGDFAGPATISVKDFVADKDDPQDITITDSTSNETVTELTIKEFGGGEKDVIRFDLSGWRQDFDLIIQNESPNDIIIFEGVHTVVDNGDGTQTITYYDTDDVLHTINVDPDTAQVQTYYAPDEIVTGSESGEVMDVGYTDEQGDSIDGADGITDTIFGRGGGDTISGGAGNDTIYGDYNVAPGTQPSGLPDNVQTGDAPTQPAGPNSYAFPIDNGDVPGDGKVSINLETLTGGSKDDPVDLLVTDTSSETITEIKIEKVGKDGDLDVIRIDLAGFDDSFRLEFTDEGTEDKLILDGVHEVTDDGDGTWTVTYYDTNDALHTIDLRPGDLQLEFYAAPTSPYAFDDTIDGGAGNDVIDGGYGDDDITGGEGDDTIKGNIGADTITGDAGSDTIHGGAGDDTISGGDGSDIIYGGDGTAAGIDRVAFEWSAIPDPGDGGAIDNDEVLENGTQTVRGVDIGYSFSNNNASFQSTTINTSGIDAGTGSPDPTSAMSLDDTVTVQLDFSESVRNVEFRVNDFEQYSETLVIRAFDENDNPVAYDIDLGGYTYKSNTDASHGDSAGDDTLQGSLNGAGDNNPNDFGSALISISGPVARIEFDFTSTGGSLTVSDVYFDDPQSAAYTDGDDNITGGAGADTIDAGYGDDTVDAGADDDIIRASAGTDTIDGGTGSDTYDADNATSLSGETITVSIDDSGNGTVQKTNDGTTDQLTSIEVVVADETAGVDTITLTDTVAASQVLNLDANAVGTFTALGSGTVYNFGPSEAYSLTDFLTGNGPSGPGGTYQITSGDESGQVGNIAFSNFETANFSVICFARGTRIRTDRGERPIESLAAGCLVETLDHGLQPIRWIGSTRVPGVGDLAPIRIAAGALGNTRDLVVSPQHRMMLSGWQMEMLFAEPEVLAPATALVNDTTIRREPGGVVEYFHMLFDRHEIVFAEGAPAESFHPGEIGLDSMAEAVREEIFTLFPELRTDPFGFGPAARMSLKRHEALVAMEALPSAATLPAPELPQAA
jgi:Ca2+-binding RTX toxin-like protein